VDAGQEDAGQRDAGDAPDAGRPPGCPEIDADGDCIAPPEDCDDANAAIHPGAADNGWSAEVVGRMPGLNARIPRLAFDARGFTYMAYGGWSPTEDDMLLVADRVGAEWSVSTVPVERASDWDFCCIVEGLAADDRLHLSYATATYWDGSVDPDTRAWYASRTDGVWGRELVDDDGRAEMASLALGGASVELAYGSEYGGLFHASRVGEAWISESIDPLGWAVDVEVAPGGDVHVVYLRSNHLGDFDPGLWYATNASGAWVVDTLEDGLLYAPGSFDLAVDTLGRAHVCYPSDDGIRCRVGSVGDWTESVLADGSSLAGNQAVFGQSIAADAAGRTEVAYLRRVDGAIADLVLAVEEAGGWTSEVVDLSPLASAGAASFALAPDGTPHLAFIGGRDDEGVFSACHAQRGAGVDGIDQNCDGVDGVDGDGDGVASVPTGGADCDDYDAAIRPDAPDAPGDGVDSDCDGADG
jgi:hypothetical protein